MNLFGEYRAEDDQELINAARQAYLEAKPEHNTARSVFAWRVDQEKAHRYGGPADNVPRADVGRDVA